MLRSLTRNSALLSLVFLAVCGGPPVRAESGGEEVSPAVDLALMQSQLADKFRSLEAKILKIAEYDASTNPRRSALLKQALAKGKQRQIAPQLDELVRLLREEQLQKAVDSQGAVRTDLYVLLELLLSENRPDRLKSEQSRVRNYIKQLDRIIRKQKSVQGRTEGGEEQARLARDQADIAERTHNLGDAIDQAEGSSKPGSSEADQDASPRGDSSAEPSDQQGQPGDSPSGGTQDPGPSDEESSSEDTDPEGESGSQEDSRGEPDDPAGSDSREEETSESDDGAEPGAGDTQPRPSEEGPSSESPPGPSSPAPSNPTPPAPSGSPQPGSPSPGSPGSPSPNDPSQAPQEQPFPGRKRIAAAEDRMQQAREQLEKAERQDALQEQEEARRLLEQAKAELEEILRQLREEEIERVLAMLEGRFRKMLEMELRVQAETVRLNKTPANKRTRQFSIKVGALSLDQRKIVLEVDKALTLLREEGSSVAFPEAVLQLRTDMESVANYLADEKVGAITQTVEEDIILALEEIIAALQKAQQEAEERRNQPGPPPGGSGDPSDQPLVDSIAELKMIRALQMRINTRTVRFANMLADADDPVGQATDNDLVQALRDLSDRQERIHEVTSDIVLGKNK